MARTQGFVALLQRHYDKIVALVAILALLASVLNLVYSGARNRRLDAAYAASLDSLQPQFPLATPVSLQPYSNALAILRRPFRIPVDPDRPVGFFVPESRVWCVACRRPIPRAATNCPYAECGAAQPREETEKAGYDGDGGGIPDKDELRYGLNPSDPADDIIDSDGDGFSNLDEHLAGTDPKDPKSHPDLAVMLRVVEIVATRLPLKFMGATTMPDGRHRCQINLKPEGGAEALTYFVTEGEQIGKTEFRLLRYGEKTERRPDPMFGGRERDFVTKQVVVARGKKEIVLTLDKEAVDTDYTIKLLLPHNNKTFDLTAESDFQLGEDKWRVISVDSVAHTVVLRNDADRRELTVPKL